MCRRGFDAPDAYLLDWQALDHEAERVVEVFLHADTGPDRVLIERGPRDRKPWKIRASETAAGLKTKNTARGGIYLLDLHANLVIYFSPELYPRDPMGDVRQLPGMLRIG